MKRLEALLTMTHLWFFIIGLLAASFVFAQGWSARFDWNQTQTREPDANGVVAPLTEPEFIRNDIICAKAGVVFQNTSFANETVTIDPWPHGTDTCYIVTWATRYDNLTGELVSKPSVSVQVIVPKLLANPNAPTGVTVTVTGGGGGS